MQPGTKKKFRTSQRSTKSQAPGFSLTRHKKPGKCGILGGAKRAGFSLRTDLSVCVLGVCVCLVCVCVLSVCVCVCLVCVCVSMERWQRGANNQQTTEQVPQRKTNPT